MKLGSDDMLIKVYGYKSASFFVALSSVSITTSLMFPLF